MRDVYEFAKYFMKIGADSKSNTFDGNMKLQKLLVLSDLASIAEYGKPLFDDQVLAFKNGCVIERVRLRYKNNYNEFKQDSDQFQPNFSEEEYTILNLIMDIYGNATAKELSEINHTFDFWKEAYRKGTNELGFHDKSKSIVDMMNSANDVIRMREVIDAYKNVSKENTSKEIINGITFYYDGFVLTDEMLEKLEDFSLLAEDSDYSVYIDCGRLVIL